MKVNNSEGGLQYFIQQMAPYTIFEIKLSTIDLKTISFKSEMARGMEVESISKYWFSLSRVRF